MKLVVIGGGGVRSPFLAKTVISQAKDLGIRQVVFHDTDPEKLRIYGGISKKIAALINPDIAFVLTSDTVEAVTGADIVITTIRVGGDAGRARDERLALQCGILGQETTGAGGFSMSLRSVPVIAEICELVRIHANPGVLVFNFTNPSGIVTQAMRDMGYDFVYGICDAPSGFIRQLQHVLDVPADRLSVECFGLNHLSWFRHITVDGADVTEQLLGNPRLYEDTEMKLFNRKVVELMDNALPNEYLYFYLFQEQAIDAIRKSAKTRGETIRDLNEEMLAKLLPLDMDRDFEKAFAIYMEGFGKRENSYMAIESGLDRAVPFKNISAREMIERPDEGGYAGVALSFIKAYQGLGDTAMVLSVPNQGAISGLRDSDVVEITCRISRGAVTPVPVSAVPDILMNLIRTVKTYEQYTVSAIRNRSRDEAVTALMFHPLVSSYSLAVTLVDAYLDAFSEQLGAWT